MDGNKITLIYNIENFLLINGADSVEKIDDILIKLEDISEISSNRTVSPLAPKLRLGAREKAIT